MPRRKKGTTWQTWILIGAIAFVLATAGALLGGAVGYWWLVVKNPGPHIDREYIRAAITPETSVYFADGSTKLIRRRDRYSDLFDPELDVLKMADPYELKKYYNLTRINLERLWAGSDAGNGRKGKKGRK